MYIKQDINGFSYRKSGMKQGRERNNFLQQRVILNQSLNPSGDFVRTEARKTYRSLGRWIARHNRELINCSLILLWTCYSEKAMHVKTSIIVNWEEAFSKSLTKEEGDFNQFQTDSVVWH